MGYSSLYKKSGEIIEITIRDSNRKKLEYWTFNVTNRELGSGILNYIKNKYGLHHTLSPAEHVENREKKEDKTKDVDFLNMKDIKW